MDHHRHLVTDPKDRVPGRTRHLGAEFGVVAADPIPVEIADEDLTLDPTGETSTDKIGAERQTRLLSSVDFQRLRTHHRLQFAPAWGNIGGRSEKPAA